MRSLKLLALLLLAAHDVYGSECNGFCGQGEGDCDSNSECLDGLVCEFDGWWGTDYCRAGPDTVDFSWSEWGDWTECSVQCGADGTQDRFRYCNAPQKGGYPCPSQTQSDTQTCNNGPCPVDGGWGEWSEWSECPVSCGGGENTRIRTCDNPVPEHGGADCVGDASETGPCNENPCPIDGGFSEWDEWSACTVECGGGDQTRSRRCDNPVPEFGGLECEGDFTECQRCNMDPCPSSCPA